MSQQESKVSAAQSEAPAPGTWIIDATHSFVSFSVEHFTVALARGIASGPTGVISITPDLATSTVEASIDVSTLTTGNAMRDSKILGPDVLDVEQFKTIDYSSSGLRSLGNDRYELIGSLSLHGVTRPTNLTVTFNGVIVDTWGKTRLGLTATADLRRDEFGSGDWGHAALPSGGFMVPHIVKVTLDIEAIKEEPTA